MYTMYFDNNPAHTLLQLLRGSPCKFHSKPTVLLKNTLGPIQLALSLHTRMCGTTEGRKLTLWQQPPAAASMSWAKSEAPCF